MRHKETIPYILNAISRRRLLGLYAKTTSGREPAYSILISMLVRSLFNSNRRITIMKKLLSATLLVSAMAFSSAALAHSEWYGKEGQDEKPSYMEHALSRLPADKAADFRDTMKGAHEDNRILQERLHRLHGDLHAILTAPTFDENAFLAKRAEIQQVHDKMENNRTEAFTVAVSELSQDERVTLTRALDHAHHGHPTTQMQNHTEYSGTPDASIKH